MLVDAAIESRANQWMGMGAFEKNNKTNHRVTETQRKKVQSKSEARPWATIPQHFYFYIFELLHSFLGDSVALWQIWFLDKRAG